MTTWPFVPTRPVILDEYNDLEARYGAFGPPVSVRERIPRRHKITEAETAPGLVGGFRYVPPQFLVPDWPATAQFTPPSAQRPVTQLHDALEREPVLFWDVSDDEALARGQLMSTGKGLASSGV